MIFALRVLLLALAAVAAVAAVAIGVRGRVDEGAAIIRYACPMHPEVRAAAPGACPICRMALGRVGRPAVISTRANAIDLADFVAVENIRKHNIVDFVRRRSLLVPERELRGPASVEADGSVRALFYEDEIAAFDDNEIGAFTPTAEPGTSFAVRRLPGASLPADSSTSQLRFRFTSLDARARGRAASTVRTPRAGDVGWVELGPRPRQVLAVPASALLQSPEGPYVLAWTGVGFNFEKRPITLGETFLKEGFAVVLSGLRANERVVGRAAFFLEADRRSTSRAIETGWSRL